MVNARLEATEPDPWAARAFLIRALQLVRDCGQVHTSPEGRLILLHTATIAACDALLAMDGRQVVGSEGGHRLRIETAQSALD